MKSLTLALLLALPVAGCASTGFMSGSGPSARKMVNVDAAGFSVVDLSAPGAVPVRTPPAGLEQLPAGRAIVDRIAAGESIEISIWEAAPAVLFGGPADATAMASGRGVTLPLQVVGVDGTISVPFVGRIDAVGKTPRDIERAVLNGLTGKANRPQVMVRATSNVAQEVTVVGEVKASQRVSLTARGERLLDAIAAAGGASVPVEKATVQVTRDGVTQSAPMDRVIREPGQNVVLSARDVVTVYYQPKSFTALGAVAKPGEFPFEATGLTLAQALGRLGGTVDGRANPAGVFVARKVDGKPTIYQLDLRNPASFFAMREFEVENEDVIYVANAPAAELQKFLSLLGSAVYPLDAVRRAGE